MKQCVALYPVTFACGTELACYLGHALYIYAMLSVALHLNALCIPHMGYRQRSLHGLQVRAPTTIVSSICDDRGEEPTYNKVTMTTLMTGDYNVGDVISLLWFKRQLPKYATRFIELVVMLCADHGPCVSGTICPCSPCRQL